MHGGPWVWDFQWWERLYSFFRRWMVPAFPISLSLVRFMFFQDFQVLFKNHEHLQVFHQRHWRLDLHVFVGEFHSHLPRMIPPKGTSDMTWYYQVWIWITPPQNASWASEAKKSGTFACDTPVFSRFDGGNICALAIGHQWSDKGVSWTNEFGLTHLNFPCHFNSTGGWYKNHPFPHPPSFCECHGCRLPWVFLGGLQCRVQRELDTSSSDVYYSR